MRQKKKSKPDQGKDARQETLQEPGSLDRAATGLFEPSENPNAQLPKTEMSSRAERAIDDVEKEIERHGERSAMDGQVELSLTPGKNDRMEGPDIGSRPHRPVARKRQ